MVRKESSQSRQEMKDAMIALLLENKFEDISIKDITDRAGLHRSTFYAYYTCKHDIIDEIQKDLVDSLPVFQSSRKEDMLSSFSSFVEFIKRNVSVVIAIRNSGLAPSFGATLVASVMRRYDYIFGISDDSLKEATYVYCINGIQGVINDWIDKGCVAKIDTIASISVRLAFNTVGLREDLTGM